MFPTDSNRSEKPSQNRLPLLLFALNKLSNFIICLFFFQKHVRQPFYLPKNKTIFVKNSFLHGGRVTHPDWMVAVFSYNVCV